MFHDQLSPAFVSGLLEAGMLFIVLQLNKKRDAEMVGSCDSEQLERDSRTRRILPERKGQLKRKRNRLESPRVQSGQYMYFEI